MSMGEPTRRLNIVEADEPPAPPTLGERWGHLAAGVRATLVLSIYGVVTGIIYAVLNTVGHQAPPVALGTALGVAFLIGLVWLFLLCMFVEDTP